MALTVTTTPGKEFASSEQLTIAKLNALGAPTFTVTGTVGTAEITDSSVTAAKTVPDKHFYTSNVTFSAGDYTLTYSPVPTVVDGMIIAFKANAGGVPNVTTGIRVIIGGSTKKLFKNTTETCVLGDIVADQVIEARYDTAGDAGAGAWQMMSGVTGKQDYYQATAAGTNNYTLTIAPPATGTWTHNDLDGKRIRFKVPNTNTAACDLAVTIGGSSLTAKPIKKNFNDDLVAGDFQQYQVVEVVYEYNATAATEVFQLISPVGNSNSDSVAVGSSRNLVLQNNASGNLSDVDIDADEIVLKNPVGLAYVAKAVNLTCDFATGSGLPNGLDTGGESSDAWYYVYVIWDGTTVASLFSLSATTPTLPTGYTYKALVGAVRNVSSDLVYFVQYGREVSIERQAVITAGATSADTFKVLDPADKTAFQVAVPPIAKYCNGYVSGVGGPTQVVIGATTASGALSTIGIGWVQLQSTNVAGWDGANGGLPFRVPVRGDVSNYTIQWKARLGGDSHSLWVSGFTL